MKYLVILTMFLVSAQVSAQEVSREPSEQKIERVRDGKVERYEGDEWMIIKKGPKKPKPAPVVCEPKIIEKEVVRTVEKEVKAPARKNRISLVGGYGPTAGLKTSQDLSAGTFKSKLEFGAVGGLLYQRQVTDRLSVGIQGQTNRTGSLLLGLDF